MREKVGSRETLVAPGYIARDFMEYMKLTPEQFARRLQISESDLESFLAGELVVTKELAFALKSVTGKPADFWLTTDKFYRRRLAFIEEQENHQRP